MSEKTVQLNEEVIKDQIMGVARSFQSKNVDKMLKATHPKRARKLPAKMQGLLLLG